MTELLLAAVVIIPIAIAFSLMVALLCGTPLRSDKDDT